MVPPARPSTAAPSASRRPFGPTDQIIRRAGLYDGDTLDDPAGDPARHPHGLHFELDDNQGAFALAELGVMWPAGPATPVRRCGAGQKPRDYFLKKIRGRPILSS